MESLLWRLGFSGEASGPVVITLAFETDPVAIAVSSNFFGQVWDPGRNEAPAALAPTLYNHVRQTSTKDSQSEDLHGRRHGGQPGPLQRAGTRGAPVKLWSLGGVWSRLLNRGLL